MSASRLTRRQVAQAGGWVDAPVQAATVQKLEDVILTKARELAGTEHLHDAWTLAREYPLSPALLSVAHVWLEPVVICMALAPPRSTTFVGGVFTTPT